MKTILRAAIVGAAAFAFTAGASAQEDQPNVVEAAQATDSLSTLVTAVEAAGLVDTLSGEGPYTVFAPTNAAFEALPEGTLDGLLEDTEALTGVLTYHVASGEANSSGIASLIEQTGGPVAVQTVNGAVIEAALDGDNLVLTDKQGNEATVVMADVDVSNGVVHVIDGVLLP